MNIPKLRKQLSVKKCHDIQWEDQYSWIHQDNILEVLRNSDKLNPEVKKYLEDNNKYTEEKLKDTKNFQKELFKEIKGRIKLDDKSIPFKDIRYEYWTKFTKEGNYPIKLRKKIGQSKVEEYWNGDLESKGKKFFSVGDIEVSNDDNLLAYSIDDKGSEYFSIFVRKIIDKKIISKEIKETSGSITFSKDDKSIYYSKLDKFHRPRKIYKHTIGKPTKDDILIYEERDEGFTCSIVESSDEKFFFVVTSNHTTSEYYYFETTETNPKLKLFNKRQNGIMYSIDSWKNKFFIHTNLNAEDFKICYCYKNNIEKWIDFIPKKNEVLIGSFTLLENWMLRSEVVDALPKIISRNLTTNAEAEIIFEGEPVCSPGASRMQRDLNTDLVHISYSSPKTQGRTYLYNLLTKERKLIKEVEIPSGHNPENYVVKRVSCESHDGRKIPITILYHKNTKLDGTAKLLLYGYGSYGNSIPPSFSSSRLSLVNRNIIWSTAHIRGGLERGMKWWKEGKMLNKKNTFYDYIVCAKYLIAKKYTSKRNIIGMGGSAGGLLMGNVTNMAPELFLGMIMAVPFVDNLTTNLDHSLPLTVGEFNEFGNAKNNKKHFEYIKSYAPYHNIKKMNYPHLLITTSLSDNRVLFDEPTKFTAKLRDYKTDSNLLLLKTEMNAGHGGKSGRDSAIKEIALDYAFALKISKKIK